jgi:acyl-[acyl-carrier-protein] desaturase
MAPDLTETALLTELEPVVATNLDRHLATATEWFPHQYVPWSRGTDFDGPFGGREWQPADSAIHPVVQTALVISLLTEDNLPSYHHEIRTAFGPDSAWGTWVHRWTAEEGRHSIVIRDYLTVARAVDPVALERARMQQVQGGHENPYDLMRLLAYVSFQELATRVVHRNTGRVSGDPDCERLLTRVAADENLHMVFYRNLMAAAFELAPSQAMAAAADVVADFTMPGTNIPGAEQKRLAITLSGIYDLRQHCDDVLAPLLRQWHVWDLPRLTGPGEQARERLAAHVAALDGAARRFADRRAAYRARRADGQPAGDGTGVRA